MRILKSLGFFCEGHSVPGVMKFRGEFTGMTGGTGIVNRLQGWKGETSTRFPNRGGFNFTCRLPAGSCSFKRSFLNSIGTWGIVRRREKWQVVVVISCSPNGLPPWVSGQLTAIREPSNRNRAYSNPGRNKFPHHKALVYCRQNLSVVRAGLERGPCKVQEGPHRDRGGNSLQVDPRRKEWSGLERLFRPAQRRLTPSSAAAFQPLVGSSPGTSAGR